MVKTPTFFDIVGRIPASDLTRAATGWLVEEIDGEKMPTYMRWLADGVDRSRFALTFVCLSDGAAALADELSARGWTALAWQMNRYKINPFTDAQVIWRLFKLIRREKFDLVHAHGSKGGFIARIAAIGSGVPVVYSPHNFSFHEGVPRWQATIFAFVEKLAARFLTAKIMTVSNGEQTMARQFGVGKPELFTTVHSGVDLAAFEIEMREGAIAVFIA